MIDKSNGLNTSNDNSIGVKIKVWYIKPYFTNLREYCCLFILLLSLSTMYLDSRSTIIIYSSYHKIHILPLHISEILRCLISFSVSAFTKIGNNF